MTDPQTIADLLAAGADDAVAIAATANEHESRPPLTYGRLRRHMQDMTGVLNGLGVGRNDKVAIVLPNGPDMAVAFVSIAAGATTAPLNPSYRQEEFEFYMEDLAARALVVRADDDGPARAAAMAKGIPILDLAPDPEAAGLFTLSGGPGGVAASPGPAEADDVALVLHTSGTTSRPKIVPLTHRNVAASARNIAASLALTPGDVELNIMPLFHIHGLIAAVLSSLGAGAAVWCTPGFNALKFFGWLEEANPTWYTGVPTMHQAILSRAGRNAELIETCRLRLIRSSSASLPPQVMAAVEEAFGCPVVEAYGMTEAAHQMASNPLPPAERKPGAVGVAAGPEIGIMDPDGALLATGATGEVVIRGENITPGYESNPKANAEAFTGGWFRTGDQGVLDTDGYLTITGRLKEIINRGGEKISPREVDEILLDHPAVDQVVTFAIPHDKLGEEVCAAVVLKEGAEATDREIRDFAAARLADFKVPRKVIFLEEIPKGATGKLQRIGLHEKLAEHLT